MPSKSKVERLPDAVKVEINAMLLDGHKLDDIMDWLRKLELPDTDLPSRSSLGRYSINQQELARSLKQSRVVAEALAAKLGDEGAAQQNRVAIEVLQTIVMKMSAAVVTGEAPDLSPQDINYLSRTVKDLTSATDVDDKRRRAIRAEVRQEAADAARTAVSNQGISAEIAEQIYRDVLGVDTNEPAAA